MLLHLASYKGCRINRNYDKFKEYIKKHPDTSIVQMDITRMMNHINSYKRKKLNDRSPYDTFSFLHGEEILSKLGCLNIQPENITLTKNLLKK